MPLFRREPSPDPDPERFGDLMVDGPPDFEELLRCVFGITGPVADVYRYLHRHPGSTVKDIARALECDRSTANRKLDTLREKNLVTRNRDLLSGGGITYRYEPVPVDQVRDRMHETLAEWTAFMHDRIDAIPDDLGAERAEDGRR